MTSAYEDKPSLHFYHDKREFERNCGTHIDVGRSSEVGALNRVIYVVGYAPRSNPNICFKPQM